MNESNKLQSIKFSASFLSGSFLILLLGMTFLCATHPASELQQYAVNQNEIQKYEQLGNYVMALKIARTSHEEALKMGLSQEAAHISPTIKRLEEEVTTLGFSRLLFDENYQPRANLLQLLQLVGMESLDPSEKPIIQINNWAQKNLLRQGERWHKQDDKFEALKPELEQILSELGFIDTTFANFTEYQGALLHGALLPKVRHRLYWLVEQWKQGIRFSHLYFLSGARPLESSHESRSHFIDDSGSLLKIRKNWKEPLEFPKTECEMTELVWNQSEIPQDMRQHVHVHFINAPMKVDSKGQLSIRPNTDDTVIAWLQAFPLPGRYLAATNAPYTNRQDLVVRAIAPNEYGLDTIGPGARKQEKVTTFLDELARVIYQTKRASEK